MTVDEIFSHACTHMVEGVMVHLQMSDYFNFLGLKGYYLCHRYHYYEENNNYLELSNYYLTHYNKIPVDNKINNPQIIPENWYKYTRQDVDNSTRKASIQQGFEKWINWEKQTKAFYVRLYEELLALNEVAASTELERYIKDVDYELAEAEQILLELKALDFNVSDIILEQDKICKDYKKRIKEIEL